MTDDERLAILIALEKATKEELDRRNPNGARGRADAQLLRRFSEDGTDRRVIRVGKTPVGTLSVRITDGSAEQVAYVEDADAFARWFFADDGDGVPNGWAIFAEFMRAPSNVAKLMRYVSDEILTNGVIPDGVTVRIERTPDRIETTARGFKPAEVAEAFGAQLPAAVAGALTAPGND